MKHSSSRYRFGRSDLYTARRQLQDVVFHIQEAERRRDELVVHAVDNGLSFSELGDILGVSKTTAHTRYAEARRRESFRHANDSAEDRELDVSSTERSPGDRSLE